jgi:hypothetical protein
VKPLRALMVEERLGGYGDRTGNKHGRYVAWLELDLADAPDDARTLFYLASAYGGRFIELGGMDGGATAMRALHRAEELYLRHLGLGPDHADAESRFSSAMALAQMNEHYLHRWAHAHAFYREGAAIDPARVEPHYFIGSHLRAQRRHQEAAVHLHRAAMMVEPVRSTFVRREIYTCQSKLMSEGGGMRMHVERAGQRGAVCVVVCADVVRGCCFC